MKIEVITPDKLEEAKNLLQKNNLPTEDINEHAHLFGTYEEENLVAVGGVELYGPDALIRSICVDEAYRSQGMAEILTEHIEQYAKKSGADCLYLLTTTADNYFKRKGFVKIERHTVPQAIKQSSEFSAMCPASATVMKKNLELL